MAKSLYEDSSIQVNVNIKVMLVVRGTIIDATESCCVKVFFSLFALLLKSEQHKIV